MSALFEFVLARVAEDQAVAHAAATTPMREFDTAPATMRHIVRWDPARVRVECAAKRNMAEWADAGGNLFVLCQLAAPYEDHPDWCEEWRQGSLRISVIAEQAGRQRLYDLVCAR